MAMSRLRRPVDEILDGAIWPLLPLSIIFAVLLVDAYPMFFMSRWLIFALLAFVIFALIFIVQWPWRAVLMLLFVFLLISARTGWELDRKDVRLFNQRYYGPIEGRVVDIDQSHSGKLRLTLADVELDGRIVTHKVRISLHGDYHAARARAGAIIQTTGFISPPNGPPEPGGYDFRKQAWLDGIVGVGYTKNPSVFSSLESQKFWEWILDKRREISGNMREQMGAKTGGFAAAIAVGDKSELDPDLVQNMRNSNLAHLLAISGMHVGTICGLMFFMVRRLIGAIPRIQNSYWPQRIAVIMAILAASVYWLFSGMAYSATRAYFMSMLFLLGFLLGRNAFSLRSIAMVASGILIFDPFALFDIGFQMSFVATIALVVGFGIVPVYQIPLNTFYRWLLILCFTSLIAGFATAPIAAYYFNQIPKYGLLANVLAVPVLSFWVMPCLILYAFLSLFHLESWAAWMMHEGISWIIAVADYVGGMESGVWTVGAAHPWSLGFVYIAALSFVLFRGRFLNITIAILFAGILLWNIGDRPYLLVAETARFFGIKENNNQRQFSRATGHSFLAEIWAKRDGENFDQKNQALDIENDFSEVSLEDGWRLIFTTTKKGATKIDEYCNAKTLIIAAQAQDVKGECILLNETKLARMGGAAIEIENGELTINPFLDAKPKPWGRFSRKNE